MRVRWDDTPDESGGDDHDRASGQRDSGQRDSGQRGSGQSSGHEGPASDRRRGSASSPSHEGASPPAGGASSGASPPPPAGATGDALEAGARDLRWDDDDPDDDPEPSSARGASPVASSAGAPSPVGARKAKAPPGGSGRGAKAKGAGRGAPPRRRKRQRSLFWSLVFVGASVSAVALGAFAGLTPSDGRPGPAWHWAMLGASAIRNMALHAGVGLLALAGVALLTRRWLSTLTLGLVACVSLAPAARVLLSQQLGSQRPIEGPTVRIITHNVRGENDNWAALSAHLRGLDADTIVIQEGVGHWGRELPEQLGASHPHSGPPKTGQIGTHRDGVWVLSAAEPLSRASILEKAPDPGYIVRSEILIGDRAVALYAVHLPKDFEPTSARLGRLTFLALTMAIEGEALPVILAGDFNATPSSWRMARLRELGLRSVVELAGSGRGATWPAWAPGWAGVAIDHIMIGPELACRDVRIGEPMGSDHRPLFAEIGFRRAR